MMQHLYVNSPLIRDRNSDSNLVTRQCDEDQTDLTVWSCGRLPRHRMRSNELPFHKHSHGDPSLQGNFKSRNI